MKTLPLAEQHARLVEKRDRQAHAAWERALTPARRPLSDPQRIPYPVAVKAALAAYDAVIAKYRPLISEVSS